LQVLDLSSNGLITLDSYSLQELLNATEVNLSNNSIHNLQPRVFSGLTNLRVLRISNNRLRHLTIDVLKPLKKLRELELRRNLISVISAGAFSTQSSLLYLDFSSNLLSSLTEQTLLGLISIRHLNMSNNIVQKVSSMHLRFLPTLEVLDLSWNSITEIGTSSFEGLSSLRYLILAHQQNLRAIHVQKVSSMHLRFLPTLEVLDLSWNSITEIGTSSFEGLSSLRYLILAHQQNLRAIHLNAFSGLTSLTELDLSSCRALESIDKNAFESSLALRSFDISRCAFRSLPPTLLDWNRLSTLNVYGNPLHCDIELLSFLPRVLRQLDIHNASCFSPTELRDQDIASLEAFVSSMSEWELSLIIVCSVLTVLSLLAVPICWIFHHIGLFTPTKPKSRTPLYDQSILSGSLIYDKSDLLTKQTFYSPSELSASTASTFEDAFDRYGKLRTSSGAAALIEVDQEEQIYETPNNACSVEAQQALTSQDSLRVNSNEPSSQNLDGTFNHDVPTFPAPPITKL
uniref:Leucine-rich repeat-containing protein 32 n=1 Tax=Toxocara canis TaxID=6265 RepID=A0A183V962_TOXCA